MNYLAHIYLSGEDREVLFGNFIGDAIKGKQYEQYTKGVQKGILLHRAIDAFTDTHEIPFLARKKLRSIHGKYAGVVLDILYDHFLAVHWEKHHHIELEQFTLNFYQIIDQMQSSLPHKMTALFEFMRRDNWLYQYKSLSGLDRAFKGLAKRTRFESGMEFAKDYLIKNYDWFEENFNSFFPDLISFAESKRSNSQSNSS